MALETREDGGHLETEGQRYGLLQIAASDHRCVAIAARQFRQRVRNGLQVGVDQVEPLAYQHHGGGVGDVLRGRAPVTVFAELVAAQRIDLRHDAQYRVADALRLGAQLGHVDLADIAIAHDLLCGLRRDDAEAALHDRQRLFDFDVFRRAVLVGPDAAHRVGAEDVSEDG